MTNCTSPTHTDEINENGCCDTCGTFANQAGALVWCENVNAPAHGNGAHREQPNCRYPHYANVPTGNTPAVGHPLTIHD